MGDDEPWRDLGFAETQAPYESPSQNARHWTEGWVAERMFCPNCGSARLTRYVNNQPVRDFRCETCSEDYELKSKKGAFGPKLTDGAYRTMTARLLASDNPNLLLMSYDRAALSATNLAVVPKHFFTPDLIEPRPPLSATARRAGWQGCNILLGKLPDVGRIWLVRDGEALSRDRILEAWQSTLFLRRMSVEGRGWLIEVLNCIELIGRQEFSLDEVYAFEPRLSALYPGNSNVRPKIRQQLQVLRDAGVLDFMGRGTYRLRRPV